MKAKLLFAVLFCTAALSAQTQYFINWSMATTTEEATITVAPGDIVTWFWMDPAPHSVTSLPGSIETFDSGVQAVGNEPVIFSYTFTEVGENPYHCIQHSMMAGVITVSDIAAVDGQQSKGLMYYPNPVNDAFTLQGNSPFEKLALYDTNGKLVFSSAGRSASVKIYMSGFAAGNYFLHATAAGKTEIVQILKK